MLFLTSVCEMNLYVGNLSYSVTSEELEEMFAPFGNIVSAKVITNGHNGRSKGFGFVEFSEPSSGEQAIAQLDGQEIQGRTIVVNQARPKDNTAPRRPSGGSGGYGRGSSDHFKPRSAGNGGGQPRGDRGDRERRPHSGSGGRYR